MVAREHVFIDPDEENVRLRREADRLRDRVRILETQLAEAFSDHGRRLLERNQAAVDALAEKDKKHAVALAEKDKKLAVALAEKDKKHLEEVQREREGWKKKLDEIDLRWIDATADLAHQMVELKCKLADAEKNF